MKLFKCILYIYIYNTYVNSMQIIVIHLHKNSLYKNFNLKKKLYKNHHVLAAGKSNTQASNNTLATNET